jgi:cell division protein FtsW
MVSLASTGNPSLQRELRPPVVVDFVLLTVTVALVGFSILMLYSTTGIISQEKFGDPLFYVKRQMIAAVLGMIALFIVARLPLKLLKRFSPYCLPICLFLLALPLIPGLGESSGGATRWVRFGPIRFQPGEMVKLLFILYIAGYFARHESKLQSLSRGVVKPLLLVGVVAFLYLLEPDFGSSAVLVGVTLAMATAAGIRLRYVGLLVLVACCALGALVVVSPYRMSRVMSFLAPWEDASGSGYQLIQSLIAVGSGELTGVGLGDSQQKLFFLPAAHTDFIYAVIAEELGFIGGVAILLGFLLFLWRGFRLAGKLTGDTFAYCLAVGLTLLIVLPALLNVGVVTGVLPTKGMVLPLVGYGGTSLISCLIAVGLLLGLTRNAEE